MQNRDDDALAAAVEAAQRTPLWELEVDWTGTGQYAEEGADLSDVVHSLGVERSVAGELPDEAGQVDGYVAATLEATLGGYRDGADQHIGRELSRWNPAGLRHGVPLIAPNVRASLGLYTDEGPRQVRKFTGYVRKLGHDEEDGTVELSAVDPSERLRALITLPTYGEFVNHARRRPWALTVNTQWIVDYVLRRNGIYASPPFRDDAIVACSGHGGLVANIGFNGAPISIYGDGPLPGLWTEDRNPWGMLGTPEGYNGGTAAYQEFYGTEGLRFEAGQGFGMSCRLHHGSYLAIPDPDTDDPAKFENRMFRVFPTGLENPRLFVNGYGDGRVYAGMVDAAGTTHGAPPVQLGPEPWHFFGVHWAFTTNTRLRVTMRVDEDTYQWDLTVPATTVPAAPFEGAYLPVVQLNGQCFRSWMLLQGWLAATPPDDAEWRATAADDHESQADIARGINEVLALPDVAGADSWETLRDAVSAEFGVHGFDEYGRYSFRTRTDVRSDEVDVDLDVDANLLGVSYAEDADAARNVVGFKTTARYHTQDLRAVVKAKDINEFICQPGTTTFETDWPYGAAGYQAGILPYKYQEGAETAPTDSNYFGKWDGDVVHGWTYSSIGASGGWTILDNTRSVVVRYQQVSARRVQIVVNNPGPGPVRLATAADADDEESGEPALRIGGWPLEEEFEHVEEVRDEDAIARDKHERGLDLAENEWRQDGTQVRPLAQAILGALVDGPVVLEDLPVVGDPRVQCGDVARCWFRDADDPLLGAVVKVKDAAEDSGYDMDVSVRLLPGQSGQLAPAGWTFYVDISHHQGGANPLDLERVHGLGYAACVARIGQGGGTTDDGGTHGEIDDTWWTTWRDEALALWGPDLFAGYWYLGNVETPAAQAARCASLIGDLSIPVMLDWEDGGGDWANLLACLDAFRAEDLTVTMAYTNKNYAATHAPAGASLDGLGLSFVLARYTNATNDPAGGDPRALWESMPDGFGYDELVLGVIPSAHQFTQYGRVYSGHLVDVNSHPGDAQSLADMLHGR